MNLPVRVKGKGLVEIIGFLPNATAVALLFKNIYGCIRPA
jgi:hypothetical protein